MTLPARRAAVPFVLVTVLLDVMGAGLIIPVLPALVGQFVERPDAQAYWFGVLAASYGLMQCFAAPLLAQVTHLPPADWRVGLPFFVAAGLQAIAAARLRAGAPAAPSPKADPLRGAA